MKAPSQPSPTKLSDELKTILDNFARWTIQNVEHGIYIPLPSPETEAAITAAYAEAIRSAVPEWADKAYYTKHPVTWKPVAPESNAEHYDAGFNQAIDIFTINLQKEGIL